MNRYQGKTAVITGGNSGIGLASAKRLKEEGANVVITGRDAATLDAARREFGFTAIQADVGNLADIDRMYREIGAKAGKIDLLFANAGITISPGATFTPIFGRLGLTKDQLDATAAGLLKMIPAQRFATPEDIAAGVAYLGSADAAYVIGAELTIDGGLGQI